ncbi:hypothetical protein [Pedobacter agri]|uniref:Uncharacterized protein n=1 Tax=Pedobacter agri TaxID=454586 RepID=A0A9X3DEI8_9SPHI|nr:hypothetical protein [Pedobacter agri]MCX3265666.1 hypothetical protein [Pedobacter agri]
MNSEETIKKIQALMNDENLNIYHLVMMLAILQLAYFQCEVKVIHVSRRNIMKLAHLQSLPTYHKYLKQLQALGYIEYFPSYHPGYKSTIKLKF